MKVTICGSLKFEQEINKWHEALALNGYTPYCMVVLPSQKGGNKNWYTEQQKIILDLIHLSKIEESDAILVVDTDGYIGESTKKEIMWAYIRNKAIYWASLNKLGELVFSSSNLVLNIVLGAKEELNG